MNRTLARFLAGTMTLLLCVQFLPLGAWAADAAPAAAGTALTAPAEDTAPETPADPDPAVVPEADTSAPEATPGGETAPSPVPAGDTAPGGTEASAPAPGPVPDTAAPAEAPVPAVYTLELDLNGGQVNGLQAAGWTRVQASMTRWTRGVEESAPGQGVPLPLDATLGGLLPDAPYRNGYDFAGWVVNQDLAQTDTCTLYGDTALQAHWTESRYTVTFDAGDDATPDWTVGVPYGATLWTGAETPWADLTEDRWTSWYTEGPDSWWAEVNITVGEQEYPATMVTRHTTPGGYYYTFTAGGTFYFTYGGPEPRRQGFHFTTWTMTTGGVGYTVRRDSTFTAQFAAGRTYVFNVYYYHTDGTRVEDPGVTTQTFSFPEDGISDRQVQFAVPVPELPHYTPSIHPPAGVTVDPDPQPDGTRRVTVDLDAAFGDSASTTQFLSVIVAYAPANIQYTVEYYQQKVDNELEYDRVGTLPFRTAPYGSTVVVPDAPALADTSFAGFEVNGTSLDAVRDGIRLAAGTAHVEIDDTERTAVIQVYYDRASYFIYFMTGTSEVQLEALRLRYGAPLPDLQPAVDKLHRTGYQPVQVGDITWHFLAPDDSLRPVGDGTAPAAMPAQDLYAVVNWTPATTSVRIVYWVESRNAPGFQNVYTKTVEGLATEATLEVDLEKKQITGSDALNWQTVEDGFRELIRQRYQDLTYQDCFSYSKARTQTSPGNVANALATGTGAVQNGAITADTFRVVVNGDGTTSLNFYYTRNLYTLEFVVGRINPDNQRLWVATRTPGTFDTSGWEGTWTDAAQFRFQGFAARDQITATPAAYTYGGLNVQTEYRLADAVASGDSRAATGRYGTRQIGGFTCLVYTLTARFEAEVTRLWPTAQNIAGLWGGYAYVSMGSASDSYYRSTNTNSNILNAYSTMDRDVIARGNPQDGWTATADPGDGTVAHQVIAYWAKDVYTYTYYFLYEALDTTLTPASNGVSPFDIAQAENGQYQDGDLLSRNGKVYVFSTETSTQKSSNTRQNQNQPARHGFVSQGKAFAGNGADNADSNIYFFYTRETYTLDIQNAGENYDLPEALLDQPFASLAPAGQTTVTLRSLGWERIGTGADDQGKALIRYDGALDAIQKPEVVAWLTDEARGSAQLKYPLPSTGENQYYFSHWYRNAQQSVIVDWRDNEMHNMQANITLYAGWFIPRFTTSYALNGGTWQDTITYTLIAAQVEGTPLFLYYPHKTEAENATLYWYAQSKPEDRLFVDDLYSCRVGDVLTWDAEVGHWALRPGLTLATLREVSDLDLTGTRLANAYFCYMGLDGLDETHNHETFVNVNAALNTVLPQPQAPTRNGYRFQGWYYFDDPPLNATPVPLAGVLTGNESLASYAPGYVYLDDVGDAHLLYEHNDELVYYEEQTGYRFSYSNQASVVSRSRELYAAWRSASDAALTAYHLVRKTDAAPGDTFAPPGTGPGVTIDDATPVLAIGGTEYYLLHKEERKDLFTGSTQPLDAVEYYTDGNSAKWLPAQATIPLQIDASTQTVTPDTLTQVTGNTYRMENDGAGQGTYTYYAFFVYNRTDQLAYNVYAIDLAAAVAQGALASYHDAFDRAAPPPANAPYVLHRAAKSWDLQNTTALVTENAPAVSGYTVYRTTNAQLQLQTQAGTNNLYFYYVRDGSFVTYTLQCYLRQDGSYSDRDRLTFTQVPAVVGEFLPLTDLQGTARLLLQQAALYSTYAGSTDAEERLLYDRYKGMTVTLCRGGAETRFTVAAGDADTLRPADAEALLQNYYLAGSSPTGERLAAADGSVIEAYLSLAELIVNKYSTLDEPLSGAQFTLEHLVEDAGGPIAWNGKTYRVDNTMTAVSGTDGYTRFCNLSADLTGSTLYRLTETRPPAGFSALQEPVFLTVPYLLDDIPHYHVTYTVRNAGITYLPQAGAPGGVYLTLLLGGGLITLALLWAARLVLRRRTARRSPRG